MVYIFELVFLNPLVDSILETLD